MKIKSSELRKIIQEEIKLSLKEENFGTKKKQDFESSYWNEIVKQFSKDLEYFIDKKIEEYEKKYDIHSDASKHHLPYEAIKILLAKRY
ncbi:MAG: hypothetical protein WC306_03840 [Candidatus Paceibacterota bacterium]|jgi:hypothetical protein